MAMPPAGPSRREARLARPRPGGELDTEPENVRARDRLRAAWGHAARFRNRGHHRFDHLVTQMWPWATLVAVAFAGTCGHMAVFLSHHRHSTTDAVVTLTVVAAAIAALLASHRRTRHASRLMNLRDRAYIVACAAAAAGWIAWLTLAGVDGTGRLALIWYVPAGVALSVPWWLAHPHRPVAPPPPPEIAEEEPDPYPLIARWAAEIAVAGILPGSALSEPSDLEAGVRYMLALHPGMTIEDATQAQRKIASILGMGRDRLLFEKVGRRPGRADNERIITLTVLNEMIRQDVTQEWTEPTLNAETGYFEIGIHPDAPALCRLYQVLGDPAKQMYRAVHWMAAGLMGAGKALALDTRVPTPDGWTTMGELRRGDRVYDETGAPCRVTDAWPVLHGRPCYEVTFSDGSTVIADAEHQWLVDTHLSRLSERSASRRVRDPRYPGRNQEYKRTRPSVMTTEGMLERRRIPSGGGTSNYSVRVAGPLKGAEVSFAVPPYVLGAWLGDGDSRDGNITSADPEIVAEIDRETRAAFERGSGNRPGFEEIRSWPAEVSMAEAARAFGMSRNNGSALAQDGRFPAEVKRGPTRPGFKAGCGGVALSVVTSSILDALTAMDHVWPVQSRPGCGKYHVRGLTTQLRQAGALKNKHIPLNYLRASEEQRRALLAGLLDTDGYCAKRGGVEFCNTNERLARDVLHLVSSLGYKAALRSKVARFKGRDCGTAWVVAFTPAEKVFRLSRKLGRQVVSTRATAGHRYITDIRPVPSVPVRCVAVDTPSHLYLVGDACIPTHNSRAVDLAILEMTCSKRFVVWYGDGQNGQSSPGLRDHVDWYADWHDETVRMIFAAYAVMKARQYYLGKWGWTDAHQIKRSGIECLPWAAALPFLQIVLDEAHVPLLDQRISKVLREIMRLGPKLGIGVFLATQITSVLDLGGASGDMGAHGLRAFAKAGGNVLLYRTGETLTATSMGVPGVSIDPRTLPIDPPGMCYMPFAARPEVEVRTYHVPPDDIYYWLGRADKAALDELSVKAAGEDYVTRHARDKPPVDAAEELAYLLGEKIRGGAQDTAKSARSGGTGNLARVYQAVITLTATGPVKRSDIETHLGAQPEGAVSESSLTTCLRQLTEHGKISSPRHGHYDRPDAEDLAEERAELKAEAMG